MVRLRKEDIQAFVEGLRRAAELLKAERKKRLASLTPEEAREEFLSLWRVWERMAKGGERGDGGFGRKEKALFGRDAKKIGRLGEKIYVQKVPRSGSNGYGRSS